MQIIPRDELSSIFKGNFIPSKSVVIFGHKKSGMTFYLNYIYENLNKNLNNYNSKVFIPVFIDANLLIDNNFISNIIEDLTDKIVNLPIIDRKMIKELNKEFDYLKKVGPNNIYEFIDFYSIIRRMLYPYFHLKIALIFDNIENLILAKGNIQPLANLRILISDQKMKNNIFLIVAGGIKLYDMHTEGGSPLGNISDMIIFNNYNTEHIKNLIKLLKLERKKEIITNLNEKYGNHPLILNEFLKNYDEDVKLAGEIFFNHSKSDTLIENLFRELNNKDYEIYELLSINDKITKAELIKSLNFGLKDIENSIMHLKIANLITETESYPLEYKIVGKYFSEWFYRNCLGKIPNLLQTGFLEIDDYLYKLILRINKRNLSFSLLLDIIELMRYFGNRYIIHTRRPSFILNPSIKFLNKAIEDKSKGKIKKIRLEVDFLQKFLIEDMEKDKYIAAGVDKEVEIHGGNEDILFRKRNIRIPIELKCVWNKSEKRDIKKIIQNDFVSEINQHAQNSGFGFLIVLDIRESCDSNGIQENVYLTKKFDNGPQILVFVFSRYEKPSLVN